MESNIKFVNRQESQRNFTQVPRDAITAFRDGQLAPMLYGVYTVLLDIANRVTYSGFEFKLTRYTLAKLMHKSETVARGYLRDLQALGYISKELKGYERNKDGKLRPIYEYCVYNIPLEVEVQQKQAEPLPAKPFRLIENEYTDDIDKLLQGQVLSMQEYKDARNILQNLPIERRESYVHTACEVAKSGLAYIYIDNLKKKAHN